MTGSARRPEPIEDYLDELLGCLRLPPRATRRMLAETEDHLRQSAAEAERAGLAPADAERRAIERFGSAPRIAAAASAVRRPAPVAALGVLVWSGAMLGGIGLVAVGLSGGVAAAFNLLAGRQFVGALPHAYGLASCSHFLSLHPSAPTCAAARVLENAADAVSLRLAAGILGVILVGLAWWSRRYLSGDPSFRRLLDAGVSAVAAAVFAAAAAGLLGISIDTAVRYGAHGVGWYLSGALVSIAGAAIAAALCWRDLRVVRPWRHVTPALRGDLDVFGL